MLQVLLGQDSVRIILKCSRHASVSIPDANITHAPFSCSDRILSESRFPRRASVSIPDANITHAPLSCSDRILSELRCPRRASVSIPDAHMTHAPSPARTGFCQNNNKMSEARVGQYTRCKYDACSKSCSDRILSELRCPRRASVSLPDAKMTHAPSPARTGFFQNIKMSEARVGQYTRCKYDACSFVLLAMDRILSELGFRGARRSVYPMQILRMLLCPARTGFC